MLRLYYSVCSLMFIRIIATCTRGKNQRNAVNSFRIKVYSTSIPYIVCSYLILDRWVGSVQPLDVAHG